MTSTSETPSPTTPYRAKPLALLRATIAALAGAAAILVLFVLPAEYAIDPTGVGRALGLTRMADVDEAGGEDAAAPEGASLSEEVAIPAQVQESIQARAALRSDERTVVLPPRTGLEIKAHMSRGDHLIFRWTSDAPVRMDMHGEPLNAGPDDFSTYWKQRNLTEAQGQFTAPFDGTHGWYWRNGSDAPVTITLNTSGFYADLFEPAPE